MKRWITLLLIASFGAAFAQNTTTKSSNNELVIYITDAKEIFVDDKQVTVDELGPIVHQFITNNGKNPNWSSSPEKASIKLLMDTKTSLRLYTHVSDIVSSVIRDLRTKAAMDMYGKSYYELNDNQKKQVESQYPMNVTDAYAGQ